uniref:Uncharacterized protein n=1 Tax=Triatoma dimidiata TaxID=72491 RepID=A0A0V0G992_TRIDM
MLTEIEKNCVSDLLKILGLDDLIELAKTCTTGVIQTSNINDSINAILLHSEDIRSILMRKKITRKVLFKYLHSRNISFPGNSEKTVLVDSVIHFWNKACTVVDYQNETTSQIALDQSLGRMAVTFAEWVYNRINAIVLQDMNKQSNVNNLEILKEEDFWCDAKLYIKLTEGSNVIADYSSEGSKECFSLIRQICQEHSLFFSPNLCEEGTRGISEPHGVVLVMSCGTLHSANGHHCVGLYEQMFGLIKDPMSDSNWKIKGSKLALRSQEVKCVPALPQENQLFLSTV